MFKALPAITVAVPFRATAAPRLCVDGAVWRYADASARSTLQTHWVRVMSADGSPYLALRWDIVDPATMRDPGAPVPVSSFAA